MLSESMTMALRRRSSSEKMRASSMACSFLASSYSEFSEMSPKSRAARMRSATSSRLTDERYSTSSLRRWKPSGVRMISRSTTDSSSSTRQRGPVRGRVPKWRASIGHARRLRKRSPNAVGGRASEAEQRAQLGLVPRPASAPATAACPARRDGGTWARTGAGGRRRGRRGRRWPPPRSGGPRRASRRPRARPLPAPGRRATARPRRRGRASPPRRRRPAAAAPPPGRPRRRRR